VIDKLKISGHVGPPATGTGRRRGFSIWALALTAGALLVVLLKLVDWAVELLWFRSLGYEDVFWRLRSAKLAMFAIAFVPVFAYVLLNLRVLARHANFRSLILTGGPAGSHGWATAQSQPHRLDGLLVLASAATALFFGFVFHGHWDRLLRLIWQQNFTLSDPLYSRDIGFYLFVLPFLELVQSSIALLALGGTSILGFAYLRMGAFSFAPGGPAIDPKVLRHLTANAVLLLVAWAWGFYLDRFALLTRAAGVVFGAGYADVHVVLVGLWVALGATLGLICVLVWAAAVDRPRVTLLAIGGYLVILLTAREIIPWSVQRLIVEPNELELETPFLRNNIAFTRFAYGLDKIEVRYHTGEAKITAPQMRANQSTIDNIRIWDHRPLSQTFRQLQQIRTYYSFSDVDVDRYWINGDYRQVILAARELSTDSAAIGTSWVNRHLQYTHGYGLAMCLAAEKDDQGGPVFTVEDLPPRGSPDLKISRPEIYYGADMTNYQIVPTGLKEFDYPQGDQNVYTNYTGHGGILLDSFWKKLLLAWHQFDMSIVLSSYLSPQSRIQLWRPVQQRVAQLAPFLRLDRDPYLVIDQGRLFWIQDAYTVADGFPYSEPTNDGFSYIRNSVKVVVDAYEGDVRFYVVDPQDPLLRVYRAALPTLFRSLDEMSAGLRQHLRYPRDLFEVQADKFNTYHMTIPQVLYNREDVWASPQEKFGGETVPMEPYYVLMKLPGEDRLQFLLMTPLTPRNRDNMIAWIAARSDFPGYGEMLVYKLSKDNLVLGPLQIEATIDQDTTISRQLTLWDQRGSHVIRGNLLVIPIDQSFLYVEPVFLLAEGTNIPQLKRVIVGDGSRLAMEPTLPDAIQVVFGQRPAAPESTAEGPQNPVSDARDALQRADQALREGDWSAFGREWAQLKSLLEK
jgi:uncharacterized membrane protein (UPF0182 family)